MKNSASNKPQNVRSVIRDESANLVANFLQLLNRVGKQEQATAESDDSWLSGSYDID